MRTNFTLAVLSLMSLTLALPVFGGSVPGVVSPITEDFERYAPYVGPDWILLDNPIVDGWNLGYGDGHVEWIGKTASDQQFLFHHKNRKYGPYWFFCTW